MRVWPALIVLLCLSACGGGEGAKCSTSKDCDKGLLCEDLDLTCQTPATHRCRVMAGCKEMGSCTVRAGSCVVGGVSDCLASSECRDPTLHHCSPRQVTDPDTGHFEGFYCDYAPTKPSDCTTSWRCTEHGHCSFVDGWCDVTKDSDCAQGRFCKYLGWCSAVDGRCRIAKDSDCAGTHGCKNYGRCSAVDGDCKKL